MAEKGNFPTERTTGKHSGIGNELLKLFAQTYSRKEYLDQVVTLISDYSHCQCVGIRVLDPEGYVPYESYKGYPKTFCECESWLSVKRDPCACTRVISGNLEPEDLPVSTPSKSFFCNNLIQYYQGLSREAQSRFRGACIQNGYHSVAIIPIRYREQALGAIQLSDAREGKVPQGVVKHLEAFAPLIAEAVYRFTLEEDLQWNYHVQTVINAFLNLSQENLCLENLTGKALSLLGSVPWPALESRSAIFLLGDKPETLVLKAHSGFEEGIHLACASVPFGRCLCGRAAATREVQFTDDPDECHPNRHGKAAPYGYYAVPILSPGRVLGVIHLQFLHGHRRQQRNESLLAAVANTLAGLIVRKQSEEQIVFQASLLGHVRNAVMATDLDGKIVYWNKFAQVLYGWEAGAVMGKAVFDVTVPEGDAKQARKIMSVVQNAGYWEGELNMKRQDGSTFPAHFVLAGIVDARKHPMGYIGVSADITKQKLAEDNLRTAHQRLLDIIEFLPDATFVVDQDKKVIAWNRALEEMTGVPKEKILGEDNLAYAIPFYGQKRPMLIDLVFSEDKETEIEYEFVKKKGNTLFAETFVPSTIEGKRAFLWATASPLFDSSGDLVGAIETIRDITERKRMETQLQYLVTHDPLTNIANRYSLEETLKRSVAKATRGVKSALLLIDIDNFKLVNDSLGHAAGDGLLVTLTNFLKNALRDGDLLARLGGDEFAVLLEGSDEKEAGVVAEKLRRAVDEEEMCLVMYKSCLSLSISIGIVMIDGTLDYQKIISCADIALTSAKEKGRNRIVFLQPGEDTAARLLETNQLVSIIKNALKENQLQLFFQPVVRLSDRVITHHEALIRLRDKDGKIIFPGSFIPVAERFGLMPQIDRWVVQSSLDVLGQYPDLKLFVNLSGVSLGDEDLLEFIEEDIRKSGITPSRIGFEITETTAVKDLALTEHWISRLKSLGCKFALDDFGVGFSSFSYLRILSVDSLKIDGFFIRNLDKDTTHFALVQAMNSVAHALGKKTVAEFVENEDILNLLQTLGIDYGQGYFLGEPSPIPATTGKNAL